MDQHFPDEMTYWSERPSLPLKYKPPKKKIFSKHVKYIIDAQSDGHKSGKSQNRICKRVTIYLFNIKLFSYKTSI